MNNIVSEALLEVFENNFNLLALVDTVSHKNVNLFIGGNHQFANKIQNRYGTKKLNNKKSSSM